MQLRHRIPTIFSIYMVDVLCCALGCVVLLWHANFHEAEMQTQRAEEETKRANSETDRANSEKAAAETLLRDFLKATSEKETLSGEKKSLQDYLDEAKKALEEKSKIAKTVMMERDQARKLALVYKGDYDRAKEAEAILQAELASRQIAYDDLVKKSTTDLAAKTREFNDLSAKEKAALLRLASLDKDLKGAKSDVDAGKRKVTEKEASLKDAEARASALDKKLTGLEEKWDKLKVQEKEYLKKIGDGTALTKLLDSDLKALQKKLEEAVKLKDELSGKISLNSIELAAVRLERDQTKSKLTAAEKRELTIIGERDEQQKLALVYLSDYNKAKQAEALLKTELANVQTKYDDFAKKSAVELTAKTRTISDLSDKEVTTRLRLALLEKELKGAKSDVDASNRKATEKDASLQDAEARARAIEKKLAVFEEKLAALKLQEKEYLARIGDSAKKLDEAAKSKDSLNSRLLISAKELDDYKAANAQLKSRFAGMTLTGSKVVFLVDMSGSMEMVDENTLDPDKWPIVCDTVGKIMISLPDLKQYQVIMFSDKIRYPLGKDGQWLDYKSPEDAKRAVKAIRAVKPKDGTNMSLAFDEVFRYRKLGLDTMYFFSDGLPNMGGGLPTDARQLEKLDEVARNNLCSKYIRTQLKNVWNRRELGKERVHINTIGFFFESPEVGAFLWAMSREHDGSFVGMSRP